MNAITPALLIDEKFQDMGSCAEAVGWDFDFRQIEPGKIEAHLSAFATSDAQIARYRFNRAIHQLGCPPAETVSFGFTDPWRSSITWGGDVCAPGSMLKFDERGFDGVSQAAFIGFTVSLKRNLLERTAAAQKIDLEASTSGAPNAQWQSVQTRRASASLEKLFVDTFAPDRATLPVVSKLFEDELCSAIVSELGNSACQQTRRWRAHRGRLLRKAHDVLNDVDQLPITVSELCTKLNTSSSALHRLFQAEYGVSPKAYIRFRCLSAVRDELALAPSNTRIADIANKWGFWHMGQFAKDFRALCGELPSAILKQRPS